MNIHAYSLRDDLRAIFGFLLQRIRGSSRRKVFSVSCKSCGRTVQTGLTEFPFHSVSVECCLCHETRHYRPSEISFGMPHCSTQSQGGPPTIRSGYAEGRVLMFALRPPRLQKASPLRSASRF